MTPDQICARTRNLTQCRKAGVWAMGRAQSPMSSLRTECPVPHTLTPAHRPQMDDPSKPAVIQARCSVQVSPCALCIQSCSIQAHLCHQGTRGTRDPPRTITAMAKGRPCPCEQPKALSESGPFGPSDASAPTHPTHTSQPNAHYSPSIPFYPGEGLDESGMNRIRFRNESGTVV